MAGDVIGCCIDLDEGTISYSRSECHSNVLPSHQLTFVQKNKTKLKQTVMIRAY